MFSTTSGASESGAETSTPDYIALAQEEETNAVAVDEVVHAPESERKTFDDWDDMELYLRSYSGRTFQVC
ncbi:unnamed protein product [Phytophthora fragariaefolia]|uniref:Unnamed protein product n=1 Tax=Phytophthora fragariaefolia TaxID=1490495 RepID=A0A9W7CLS2_9STRA|nr:unnamed protein product [Phytophthora fragariaefolia]